MSSIRYQCHDCGASHGIEHIRRNLYYGQRTLGDLQAAMRGPGPFARRLVRRRVTRSLLRSLLR